MKVSRPGFIWVLAYTAVVWLLYTSFVKGLKDAVSFSDPLDSQPPTIS